MNIVPLSQIIDHRSQTAEPIPEAVPPELREKFRACIKKLRFDSRQHAKKTAKRLVSRFGKSMKPYRCPHCRKWHLATKTPPSKQKVNQRR